MIKTRIAPSPTGYFHLGTLRTALLNYLYARANNGEFILRIDDSDQKRSEDEYTNFIYTEMNRFGLTYDSTFKQSARLARYIEIASLIGILTEGRYELDMGDYKMCLVREDGYPTYNFASILDDYDYDITNIIRGVDHISNASKQQFIWNKLCQVLGNKPFPTITHAGLLFENKVKLSKRNGNGTTSDLKDYSELSILNWLLKLGWSHPDAEFDKKYKYLTLKQMIEIFNEGNINSNNCNIDRNKLNYLNKIIKP